MLRKQRRRTYVEAPAEPDGPPRYFGPGSFIAGTITLGVCGNLLGGHHGGWLAGYCGLLVGAAVGALWALAWMAGARFIVLRQIMPTEFSAFVSFVGGLVGAPVGLIYGLCQGKNLFLTTGLGMLGGMVYLLISAAGSPNPDDDWNY